MKRAAVAGLVAAAFWSPGKSATEWRETVASGHAMLVFQSAIGPGACASTVAEAPGADPRATRTERVAGAERVVKVAEQAAQVEFDGEPERGLVLRTWVIKGGVLIGVCNSTAAAIRPAPMGMAWRVVRDTVTRRTRWTR